jgi:Leucine-rich repeat (LRR) protein
VERRIAVAIKDLKLSLKYYKGYYKQIDKLNSKNNLKIYNSLPLKERNIILASFKAMRILKSYKRKM